MELAIATLFIGANALILTYARQAHMLPHAALFYLLMALGVAVLPPGGPMWFLLIIFASTALRSGRLLVRSQEIAKSGVTQ